MGEMSTPRIEIVSKANHLFVIYHSEQKDTYLLKGNIIYSQIPKEAIFKMSFENLRKMTRLYID